MNIFSNKKKENKKKSQKKQDQPKDETLKEEFIEISDIADPKSVSKADSEVREALNQATKTDLRNILMISQGRCPICHGRTDRFLFTVVCPTCGWFKRKTPEKGHSHVYLTNGQEIICDYIHHGKEEYLCIRGGVVVSEVMKSSVRNIDFIWAKNELKDAREQSHKVQGGTCAWCGKISEGGNEKDIFEDYAAFGSTQEHYRFCSEKCQRAFRKQYPSRIHRNCYETDCNTCNLCIRRFDTRNFKRNI
ncbi:MAG: hypothetical protein GXP33_04755 [Spirochaetes bacterium]|nr:hypothetical protein [Spirochaetota bacterium]